MFDKKNSTISLSKETKGRLERIGFKGESFDRIIKRLLETSETSTGVKTRDG